ncbi:MAG: CheR family methyltransferase [Bordetella sp.]|uniref:CheR family methyltransferase n=1 Tax=Bordetella sp. TaxID=28081 RepID=UPI003F7CB169
MHTLNDQEFTLFQRFIFEAAGIVLSTTKKPMVRGRLAKRVQAQRCDSFGDYYDLLQSGRDPIEAQLAVDLLTTNETYFFRETRHFVLLHELLSARRRLGNERASAPLRVWSAASSSGEEVYSIAMVLADRLPDEPWTLIGSDISSRMLERARQGIYAGARASHIPLEYRHRFCLRGIDKYTGSIMVDRVLRERVEFMQINLNRSLPCALGWFDMVFLRNVMIYFNDDTKREVVARILGQLKRGGYLLIGHSESLHGLTDAVETLAPSIYRKK